MRMAAKFLGIAWMAVVVLAAVWLGIRETFFDAPGLITKQGYGDLFIVIAVFMPGYWAWKWGMEKPNA